jgi:hypothetical protein
VNTATEADVNPAAAGQTPFEGATQPAGAFSEPAAGRGSDRPAGRRRSSEHPNLAQRRGHCTGRNDRRHREHANQARLRGGRRRSGACRVHPRLRGPRGAG